MHVLRLKKQWAEERARESRVNLWHPAGHNLLVVVTRRAVLANKGSVVLKPFDDCALQYHTWSNTMWSSSSNILAVLLSLAWYRMRWVMSPPIDFFLQSSDGHWGRETGPCSLDQLIRDTEFSVQFWSSLMPMLFHITDFVLLKVVHFVHAPDFVEKMSGSYMCPVE